MVKKAAKALMLTSPLINDRDRRAGFSLMEILVVLAIFGLSAAVIMPSTSRMLDQATSHAVFFEFQRQVSDYRREANRTGIAIQVVDSGATASSPLPTLESHQEDGATRTVILRSPWSYTLAPALDIAAGGACSATTANLINGDRIVMTLRTASGDCRFIRLQSAAAPLGGSSSQ